MAEEENLNVLPINAGTALHLGIHLVNTFADFLGYTNSDGSINHFMSAYRPRLCVCSASDDAAVS
jgi:hypothetical protein